MVCLEMKKGVLNTVQVHDVAAIEVANLRDGLVARIVTADGVLVNLFLDEPPAMLLRDGMATALAKGGAQ